MSPARQYTYVLAGLISFELCSWAAFHWQFMALAFWLTAVTAIVVGWRRPDWLAYATVLELFIGGKGYLLWWTFMDVKISVRMLLFSVLLGLTLWHHRRQLRRWLQPISRPLRWLIIWLGMSVIIALLMGHRVGLIWPDANAWLYLLLLPVWWLTIRSRTNWRNELIILAASALTAVAIKSWLTLSLFTHHVSGSHEVYRWIRQTGIGEVTVIIGNLVRVFFQSQVYGVLFGGLLLGGLIKSSTQRWWIWPAIAAGLVTMVSLSRSFWLGLIGLGLALVVMIWRNKSWKSSRRLLIILPIIVSSWMLMNWAINWPYILKPVGRSGTGDTLIARLQSDTTYQAATARKNQIQPLLRSISTHPIIGQGFGTEVKFFSTDPRINGWRQTTAFELGYLDLWLDLGLVGLGLVGWWLIVLVKKLWSTKWSWWWIPSIAGLLVINLTTPYLNHPLGLGWLMLATLYAYDP